MRKQVILEKYAGRLADMRGRTLAVVIGAIVPLAALGLASPALAVEHHPTGEFAPFADCPLSTTGLSDCILAETTSGEFTVGKKTVPINHTITLQGGFIENEKTEKLEFVGAEDGNTLSKTALEVPGGLLGVMCGKLPFFLKGICEAFEKAGITGVTATTELAAPASSIGLSTENLLIEKGTALSLPVKIKLGNLFLGNNCYVGSNAHPIVIEFTTGTTSPPKPNEPIKGTAGKLEHNEKFTLITLKGGRLVNNSFAAPEATGCDGIFSFLVDPVVDSVLGLPSAAGTNTAILEGTLSTANAAAVKASE
jgi:hypothetical protein